MSGIIVIKLLLHITGIPSLCIKDIETNIKMIRVGTDLKTGKKSGKGRGVYSNKDNFSLLQPLKHTVMSPGPMTKLNSKGQRV